MVWCGPVSNDVDLDTGRSVGVSDPVRRLIDTPGPTEGDREWLRHHLELAGVHAPPFDDPDWIVMTHIA